MKMSSHKHTLQWAAWKNKNKPKSTECQKSLMNQHSIIKVKDTCCLISFLPCFLVEIILHAMATGSPLKCESQGVLRVAACESSFFSCVLCAFGLGLWQMLDADGLLWLWCSTWCCLIFLMTGVWPGERKSAEKDALLLHTFTGTSLACYKLVCFWWLCMLSFPSFFVFGKERGISSKKVTKVQKDFIHISRQRKNATEDESNRPHMLQASLQKHRTAGKTKNQVKKYWWIL